MVEKSNEQRPNLYDYLKIIALIAMLIDHIGYYLLPECLWLRVVWRIAFPIFLFLVGFSWSYQWKNKICLTAVLLQIFMFFFYFQYGIGTDKLNILFGIMIARLALWLIEKKNNVTLIILFVLLFIVLHYRLNQYVEYGSLSFFFALRGRIAKKYPKYFPLGILVLFAGMIKNILVFDFWFYSGNHVMLVGYTVFYALCYVLFSELSKENTVLKSSHPTVNSLILFCSKHALPFYALHLACLILIYFFMR